MSLQVNAYVMLDGQANEAIRYYEAALGARTVFIQTMGQAPEEVTASLSDGQKERVAHAVLQIGDSVLYIADQVEDKRTVRGDRVSLCLTLDEPDAAQALYDALLPGSEVIEPLRSHYFSPAYGMLTDRFGVTFQIFTKRGGSSK